MSRPHIVDTFMIRDEFDMLECRLDTMAGHVDWFVAIEADVDHQNHPKPYALTDELANGSRFDRWRDKLIVVRATGLPTTPHNDDPWSREWAQRDWTWEGLADLDLADDDIVLHGDIDEICDPFHLQFVRPRFKQFAVFRQRMFSLAVDWEVPPRGDEMNAWGGTVAVTMQTARALGTREIIDGVMHHPGAWQIIRNQRNGLMNDVALLGLGGGWNVLGMPDAGWHFTWMGGRDANLQKLNSFCHPEIADRTFVALNGGLLEREGKHVDGTKCVPVDVDETWPPYVYERRCPESWFRQR